MSSPNMMGTRLLPSKEHDIKFASGVPNNDVEDPELKGGATEAEREERGASAGRVMPLRGSG
jgi:hypothetical protein